MDYIYNKNEKVCRMDKNTKFNNILTLGDKLTLKTQTESKMIWKKYHAIASNQKYLGGSVG